MADRRYLEWHGQQYRVQMKVPEQLRTLLGRARLVEPLHTDSLAVANEKKWPIVARFKGIITDAEKALAENDPLIAEALRIRLHTIPRLDDDERPLSPNPAAMEDWLEAVDEPDAGERYAAEMRAEELEASVGYKRAKEFYDIATRAITPLGEHVETFIVYRAYRQKSGTDLRRVIRWLSDWLSSEGLPQTIEAVNRRAAGRFIDGPLVERRGAKKAGAYLSFLKSYWEWLVERGHCRESPWAGQKVRSRKQTSRPAERDDGKRPYTDDELMRLLQGSASQLLADAIRIAALSGMRVEEICQLRVSHCVDDHFAIVAGKTDNARREVPIHRDLRQLIARRCDDKEPNEFLLEELPEPPPSRDTRSDPLSKRFTRYRRKCGVDERPNEKAKSNIDFHSFRRWFLSKAREGLGRPNCPYTVWTIVDVVGHDDRGVQDALKLTMSHYPGKDSDDAMRAVVEAVRLPT